MLKKKVSLKRAFILIEKFEDNKKQEKETWFFTVTDFKKALAKSKADSFDISVSMVKAIDNEGEYKTKKDALFAFNCFVE